MIRICDVTVLAPRHYFSRHIDRASLMEDTASNGSAPFSQVWSHVPDLLSRLDTHVKRVPFATELKGVVLFADISGFTALCESYNKPDENGFCSTDQLTKHLNIYFGRIVEGILLGGGDILKFAGDALLALWPCTNATFEETVAVAVTTSLDSCRSYETERDVQLRLKVGLGAGNMNVFVMGNDEARQFAITGPAIDDVKEAQCLALPGNVVASPLVWKMCHSLPYHGVHLKKDFHLILEEPPSRLNSSHSLHSASELPFPKIEGRVSVLVKNLKRQKARRLTMIDVRTIPDKALWLTEKQQSVFKTFIPKSVMRKLDQGQALEWQSEMRVVTVVFINIDLNTGHGSEHAASEDLQTLFTTIYTIIKHLSGSLNKVFLFDKGCTFLAIFGMPGEKNENDPGRGLRAARQISIQLQEKGFSTGIGVTTGRTFCGVVGHPRRHEFTVIGSRVNTAARLMMAFPGFVVCDENTLKNCGLTSKLFKEVTPSKPLKGIQEAGKLYAYNTDVHHDHLYGALTIKDLSNKDFIEGLIGREDEMEVFENELDHLDVRSEGEWRDPTCVVIEGDAGFGKSRLFDAFKAKTFQRNYRVVCGHGGQVESLTPFHAVKTLVARLLDMQSCHTAHEREMAILRTVSDELKPDLPLLNELLGIKFVHTSRTQHLTSKEHSQLLHVLLFKIVHQSVLQRPSVFFVDDAQWIDNDSWSFLYDLASDPNGLLVLSMRPSRCLTPSSKHVLDHPHTRIIRLTPLSPPDAVTLACRCLRVCSLPFDLIHLITRCNGIPLFMKELVTSMLDARQLEIMAMADYNESMKEDYLKTSRKSRFFQQSTMLFPRRGSLSDDGERKVCVVAKGVDLSKVSVPHSVKDMVVSRIDRQPHGAQVVLKCASPLGIIFTRSMLAAILPHGEERYLSTAIEQLIQGGLVECAVAAAALSGDAAGIDENEDDLFCPCMASGVVTLQSSCNTLRFTQNYIQESAYGLLLSDQKRYLHRKAAETLEQQAHKCRYCGGGDFVQDSSDHHHAMKAQKILLRQKNEPEEFRRPRGFVGQVGAKRVHRRRHWGRSLHPRVSAYPGEPSRAETSRAGANSGDSDSEKSSSSPLPRLGRSLQLHRVATSFDLSLLPQLQGAGNANGLSSVAEAQIHYDAMLHARKLVERRSEEDGGILGQRSTLLFDGEWDVDLDHCECAEVLSHVYPQLVRHFKESGLHQKHLLYLIEAGAAAVETSANLNAVSYLEQAKAVLDEAASEGQLQMVSPEEEARIDSLLGQALFQMGHTEECMPHFNKALEVLGKPQPSNRKLPMLWRTAKEGIRQFLHLTFPRQFKGKADHAKSKRLLERARCLAHVSHAHHVHKNNLATVMTALQQLNEAECAQNALHQLLDAYTVMMECCQHFGWRRLGRKYAKLATQLCDNANFTPEDLIAVAHLLVVMLNMYLSFGETMKAIKAGETALAIAEKLHDLKIPLSVLPLLFHALLIAGRVGDCRKALGLLKNTWQDEESKCAEAWYYACSEAFRLEVDETVVSSEELIVFAKDFCTDAFTVGFAPEAAYYLSCMAAFDSTEKNNWSDCNYWLDLAENLSENSETYVCGKANMFELKTRCRKYSETYDRIKFVEKIEKLKKLVKTLPVLKEEFSRLEIDAKKEVKRAYKEGKNEAKKDRQRQETDFTRCFGWCKRRRRSVVSPVLSFGKEAKEKRKLKKIRN